MGGVRQGGRVRWPTRAGSWLLVAGLGLLVLSATGFMERLFYQPRAADTVPPDHLPWLAAAETVWFESPDGTRLHGWLIHAADGTSVAEAPTILHAHGNAGNMEGHSWFTEYLPPAGFNVFLFDFRGYGRSEGRAVRRGPLIDDTEAALDALLARGDIDPGRIGLYGQSLGGALGLNVMAHRPELRAAVIESSFTSWREVAASALGGEPPGPVSRLLAGMLIGDGRRPDRAAAEIERPILLLHGTADRVVPIEHGRRLAAAGPTIRLIELRGGDHNDLRSSHPEIEQMVVEFFHGHLGDNAE